MGRTVPTWRARIDRTIAGWSPFRRALRSEEQRAFDEMEGAVRAHAAASGLLPIADPVEPLMLAMLLEVHLRLRAIEARLREDGDG